MDTVPTRISRRALLAAGATGLVAAALPSRAAAQTPASQTPKRGGTLNLRAWDPPHFDHILAHAYRTHVVVSFTHSRLLKHKAGPGVRPGTFPIEGDLAESWRQVNDTTYEFKLRRGVRFHGKPPVNGRELTAEDVRYTFEYILADKGSNVSMFRSIAKVEATDRYTVRFTLKEPFAWFLDMIASPMAGAIIARECVEKFGDLKKAEAVVGTGPWMLDSYRPNVGLTLVRNPQYFMAGLPYIDRVEMLVDEDNASRTAAFLAGKYDLGWEFPGTINRSDWLQILEPLKKRRPGLQVAEFPSNVVNDILLRADKPPFYDVRVRQAICLAMDRKAQIDSIFEGVGAVNGPLPAALDDWALPIAQLGEGAKYYRHDPRRGQAASRRRRPSQWLSGQRLLRDLRLDPARRPHAARPQAAQGRGDRRPARSEGVRRLPGLVPPRQVRLALLRPPHAVPRAGQLPLRPVLHRRTTQPEPRQRPGARRPARAPAPHRRPQAAARGHPPDPAPPGAAAVLRPRAVGELRRGVGPGAAGVWAEPGVRLRGAVGGGVVGEVRGACSDPQLD